MPKFEVELSIIVEAENKEAAFADVRSHYAVVNDPYNEITANFVDMQVGQVFELEDDEVEI